jgi:hypothetical protein
LQLSLKKYGFLAMVRAVEMSTCVFNFSVPLHFLITC